MAVEASRVVLKLPNVPRLVTAVSAAVEHFAERVGFDAQAQADLVAAVEEACCETLPLLPNSDGTLDVTVEEFPDRLEVTLEHQGQAVPTAGLDTFAIPGAEAAGASGLSGLGLLSRVDRVQYKTQGGTSRMTLVKYVRAHPGRR